MKNKPLTSIIFLAYDLTQTNRLITQAALQNIIKYTDEEDYELIFIDVIPVGAESLIFNGYYVDEFYKLGKRADRKWIKRYCSQTTDPGQYACYNLGAKEAKGDYLCFFQNDVFVWEGWLKNMKYYLDQKLADVVYPDQQAKSREFVKASYKFPINSKEALQGARDAGMILMTKEGFKKTGGWNEKIKIHYGEKDFFTRISKAGLKDIVTCKTMITHLEHAAGWTRVDLEKENYDNDSTISAAIINKI